VANSEKHGKQKKKTRKIENKRKTEKNRTNMILRELPPLPKHQMGPHPIDGG
jgi:hypothetical protein